MPTVGIPTSCLRGDFRRRIILTAAPAPAPAIVTVTTTVTTLVSAPIPARGQLLLRRRLRLGLVPRPQHRLRSRLRLRPWSRLRFGHSSCRGRGVSRHLPRTSLFRGKAVWLFFSRHTCSGSSSSTSGRSSSTASRYKLVGARGSANASRQSRLVSEAPFPRSQLRPRATRMALHVVPWAPDLSEPTTMARWFLDGLTPPAQHSRRETENTAQEAAAAAVALKGKGGVLVGTTLGEVLTQSCRKTTSLPYPRRKNNVVAAWVYT